MDEYTFSFSDIFYILTFLASVYLIVHIINIIDLNVYKLDTDHYFCNLLSYHTKVTKMNENESSRFWEEMTDKFDYWMKTRNIKYYKTKHGYTYTEDIWRKTTYGLSAELFAISLFNEFYKTKDNNWKGYSIKNCYDPKKNRPRNFWEKLIGFINQRS